MSWVLPSHVYKIAWTELNEPTRLAGNRGIHTGKHRSSPGHNLVAKNGVRAYVVLSKGRGVPLRQMERERIRERYGVQVKAQGQQLEINLP